MSLGPLVSFFLYHDFITNTKPFVSNSTFDDERHPEPLLWAGCDEPHNTNDEERDGTHPQPIKAN